MPIYGYYCRDCGTRFETMRAMREADDPIECKHCESENTLRLLSMFNAQSGGRVIAGGGGCGGCSGGTCASCGHH